MSYAFGAGQQTLGSGPSKLPYAPLSSSLVVKDNGDNLAGSDRRFDFCLTYDREVVIELAAVLLARAHDDDGGPVVEVEWRNPPPARLSARHGARGACCQ